jgi:hypothetical protein
VHVSGATIKSHILSWYPQTDIPNIFSDNRAILTLTFSGDRHDSKPVTMETSMVEADVGGKGLGLSGTIMVAAFIPKCT